MEQTTPPSDPRAPGGPAARPPRRVRGRWAITAAAALCAVGLGAGVNAVAHAHTTAAGQPAGPAPATAAPASAAAPAPSAIDAELEAEINAVIDANSDYQVGVAVVDVSDGADPADVHEYGVQAPFVAASTAKVLAAEAYYHLVETGEASLDDRLGAYTAEFQLQAMIQQSDNDSWSLIMDAVGHEELAEYAASIGVDYAATSNTLTPAEMARILGGLYSGELLEPADTAQLLSYMQDTNNESLIPAAVPDGITVFHKYGLLNGALHDAGILAKDGKAYAVVIYTKGAGMESVPARTEVIHDLTSAVAGALF